MRIQHSIKSNDDSNLKIYPNPSFGIVNISGLFSGDILIEDMLGNHAYSKTNAEISTKIEINLSQLAKGMYIVRLNSEEKTLVKKLLIE